MLLLKRKIFPASVCDRVTLCLGGFSFRFTSGHSLSYRRRCSPFNHSRFVKLQAITSSQPTFMCIDALDECVGVQRFKVLDSLNQILEKSPGTRIFMTGRPHIRPEIDKRLAGRAISLSVGPSKDDITTYLHARLAEDETPDAMDESLEAEILEMIPEHMSEMLVQ